MNSSGKRINKSEALHLLTDSDLLETGNMADQERKRLHPDNKVTFVVDRNINYTNVCVNRCSFCAFYRHPDAPDSYVLKEEELFKKIEETIEQGGSQILIQGGLHPDLDLTFYTHMLKSIKARFRINIHGFSPPEITYMAKKSGSSIKKTLKILKEAGLDSIPGGGAEILSDRVREKLSPKKIKSGEWLKVMEESHNLGMRTTATMMFGSLEEPEDIIDHLEAVRNLQDKTGGFTAFIPWSFQPGNTELLEMEGAIGKLQPSTGVDYLKIVALSRLYMDNINNIQASWVTQGVKMAQVALRFGANDFGSTMIEENVVKAAGVTYRVTKEEIINAIISAGFKAAQRNTGYEIITNY